MKLKVGEKYELNNGEVHECTGMDGYGPNAVDSCGYGPFIVGGSLYHIDGRHGNDSPDMKYSVKRHIPSGTTPTNDTLDYFTNAAIRSAVFDALEDNRYDVARSLIDYLENPS